MLRFPSPPLALAAALLAANFLLLRPGALPPRATTALAEGIPAQSGAPDKLWDERLEVGPGDTLLGLLVNAGVAAADAQDATVALRSVWNPRDLKAGQEITVEFTAARLKELRLKPAAGRDIVVARAADGHFASAAHTHPLERVPTLAAGTIHSSLFEAASEAGVPLPVLTEMIRAFSYDVDFQREVQPGDSFELLFDRVLDQGKEAGAGELTYAAMTLSGKVLRLYRYTPSDTGIPDFFNDRGASVRKALLRTPVDGARLTSGFGMRRHPILGYTKMHKGVDFGAPSGTPIMAAGNGTVEKAGWAGAYGNFVLLRHANGYETAYAHMSQVAAGLHPGQHVRQGEIIGYVGATGRATGPHLHYEVRIAGKPTNPMSVKMPSGRLLAGKELASFQAVARAVEDALPVLRGEPRVAALTAH